MDIPPPPSPLEFALTALFAFVLFTGAMIGAARLRRATSRPRVVGAAGFIFAAAAAGCLLFGLSLVYPHQHHEVDWTSDYDLNYWVDAAIGLFFWAAFVVTYVKTWRRP